MKRKRWCFEVRHAGEVLSRHWTLTAAEWAAFGVVGAVIHVVRY